jgi:hypothetical protein
MFDPMADASFASRLIATANTIDNVPANHRRVVDFFQQNCQTVIKGMLRNRRQSGAFSKKFK